MGWVLDLPCKTHFFSLSLGYAYYHRVREMRKYDSNIEIVNNWQARYCQLASWQLITEGF